ncbi:MAG: hypothetical protein FWG10_06615 [Eubacteriaceae bacterium]|nr:hypothetical protein [Eubacteriaceae bacterium]
MLAPTTTRFEDNSTQEGYSFVFYCDKCGWQWQSGYMPFQPQGFQLPIDEAIFGMLWSLQHREAYESANREAGVIFNRCKVCGARFCDDCLLHAQLLTCGDCLENK